MNASVTATIKSFKSLDKFVLSSIEERIHSIKATSETITPIPTIIFIKKKDNIFDKVVGLFIEVIYPLQIIAGQSQNIS
jgi:hypothetical protein